MKHYQQSFLKATVAAWTVAFLLVPSVGHGQETELPIAIGDSVRVELPAMYSRTGEPLEGPRVVVAAVGQVEGRCMLLDAVTDSDESDNAIVLMKDGYQLHRVWPETSVISGATLATFGVGCLEIRFR